MNPKEQLDKIKRVEQLLLSVKHEVDLDEVFALLTVVKALAGMLIELEEKIELENVPNILQ